MKIGKKIIELREEKSLSQTDLGKKISVHYTSIGRWEREETYPDAKDLAKLAEALGVSSDYLIFDNAPRSGKLNIFDLELLKQFEEMVDLAPDDIQAVKKFLDGFLLRAKLSKKFSTPQETEATR